VIADYSFEFSHWNAKNSLREWLIQNKVPGIFDVDTRALTHILREKGTMLGKIEVEDEPVEFYDPNKDNLVAMVSTKEKKVYGTGKHKIILVDTGAKNNILRCLLKRDTTVTVVPWDYDFTTEEFDGIMLSNGPGDPQMCKITIEHIKKAMAIEKPIFGICLGNQLLGIASGASTYKLKYGHRAHNHPVIKVGGTSCYITSQNHGFAIDNSTLSDQWEPLFVNLNDNTNEGIKHKTKPFFSTQFHPEASSGPTDTEFLFDDFINLIIDSKK
jgi:carbamoyl-phosphate synthase small subunit